MSFYAYLDVDNGESLSIEKENGLNQGKALAAFLGTYLWAITEDKVTTELRWFTQLEKQTNKNLRILPKIIYGEDLLYSPDEYNQFIANWGRIEGEVSEAEFRQRLEDLEKMWTPIYELLLVVDEMIRLLPQMGEDTHWYVAEDTQPAFIALLSTLKRALNAGGSKVRILIR